MIYLRIRSGPAPWGWQNTGRALSAINSQQFYWKSLLKVLFPTVIAIALGFQTQKCLLHI
jgi:hypothetical protein